MSELIFFYNPMSRARIVHWMLEEVGVPYTTQLVRFDTGEHKRPEFLGINPMGKLPTIKHGNTVVTEAAAICTYLADEFPQAKLNIPIGDKRRGPYLKWLFFSPGWTPNERKRLYVIGVLFLAAAIFWSVFEQAGSTLNLFADRSTRTELLGMPFPSSWFQSLNSLFLIALAPVFAWIWMWLGPNEPSVDVAP